jgi:signal transduction histidine kinase
MVSSDSPGVGSVEEVMCDPVTKTSALSVPLFQGRQTVGVLLVWSHPPDAATGSHWTQGEKEQISRAAQSLSLALSMDAERKILQKQSEKLKTQLSDALHQVKNPIQALRTYGKLLQRKLADSDFQGPKGGSPQLLELTRHLVAQSDRVVDLMSPFDTIVKSLPSSKQPLALNPYRPPMTSDRSALTPWRNTTAAIDYWRDVEEPMMANNQTIEFTRGIREYSFTNGVIDFARDSSLIDAAEVTESSIVARDEVLEMGFVMDILDPILSAGRVLASEKGVDLQIIASNDLPGVWVSPTALQEAVSNVMDNAIKYVTLGQSSYPRVVVEIDRHPAVPGVVIRVSDNGPGIPLDEQNDIFKRGHRGERTLHIGGSGIGLDISRSMMTRMGGELRLAGSSDNGSTFEFILYRVPKL